MIALDFLKSIPWLPASEDPTKITTRVSNSELKRWLDKGAIVINGLKPSGYDEVSFPVQQLVFFPKGKRRTTYL